MPTFAELEASGYFGQPAVGVKFVVGNDIYAHGQNDIAWTFQDVEYQALAGLEVGNIAQDAAEPTPEVTITMPFDTPVAARFLAAMSPETYDVEVYWGHFGSTEGIRVFKGTAVGADFSLRSVVLTCASKYALLKVLGLRRTFSVRCQHQFGEPDTCGVDLTPFTHDGFADVISNFGATIDAAIAGTFTDGYFNAGLVKRVATGDWRMVTNHVGTTLTLLSGFADLVEGESLILRAGCDHHILTCHEKFDNKRRCGCWPNVPTKNPVTSKLV